MLDNAAGSEAGTYKSSLASMLLGLYSNEKATE